MNYTTDKKDTIYVSYGKGKRVPSKKKAVIIVSILLAVLILGGSFGLYGYMVSDNFVTNTLSVTGLEDVINSNGTVELGVEGCEAGYKSEVSLDISITPALLGYSIKVEDDCVVKVENNVIYALSAGQTVLFISSNDGAIVYKYNVIVYDKLGNLSYSVNFLNEQTHTILKVFDVTSGKSMAQMGFETPTMPTKFGYTARAWVIFGERQTFFSDTIVDHNYTIVVDYEPQQVELFGGKLSTGTIAYKCPMDEFSIADRASSGSGKGYSFKSSNMPKGLVLQEDGVIYGTPFVCGDVEFDVQVTDINGSTDSATFTLTIDKKVLDISIKNTTVVYDGTEKAIQIRLSGIAENDDVKAIILYSTTPIEKGTYFAIFAGLTGADSDSYTYNTYIEKSATLTIA